MLSYEEIKAGVKARMPVLKSPGHVVACGEPIPLSKGCMKKGMVKGWMVCPCMLKTLDLLLLGDARGCTGPRWDVAVSCLWTT